MVFELPRGSGGGMSANFTHAMGGAALVWAAFPSLRFASFQRSDPLHHKQHELGRDCRRRGGALWLPAGR